MYEIVFKDPMVKAKMTPANPERSHVICRNLKEGIHKFCNHVLQVLQENEGACKEKCEECIEEYNNEDLF
jgi:hypothetical protein